MTDDLRVRFLIVDDEQSIRKPCMTIGASMGFGCSEAESAEAALAVLETQAPDIVLTDLMLPSMTAVQLLQRIKPLLPRTELAIMTGHRTTDSAVPTIKLCAY